MNTITDFLANNEFVNTSTSGRVVSALSGAAIIAVALKDKKAGSIAKWIKIGTGATLILRAVSGFCPANKALGIDHSTKKLSPLSAN